MTAQVRDIGGDPPVSRSIPAFLVRRLREAAGVCLLAAAAGAVIAVFGYDASDPSWNHAIALGASNPLGDVGARAADLLVQSVGAGTYLLAAVLACWGWRLFRHRAITRPWARVIAFVAALALAVFALDSLPSGAAWSHSAGVGGVAGHLLAGWLLPLAEAAGLARLPTTLGAALAALAASAAALGVSLAEWRSAFAAARPAARSGGRGIVVAGTRMASVARWLRRTRDGGASVDERVDPPPLRMEHPGPAAPAPARSGKIVAGRKPRVAAGRRAAEAGQASLDLGTGEYVLPPLDALDPAPADAGALQPDDEALAENARLLESVLEDFGVHGRIVKVRPGPVVTLYELEPAPGTKSARVIGLADDIARSMSAVSVRVAVVRGRNVIGIELPNMDRELVVLRELVSSKTYERHRGALPLVLGKNIGGDLVMEDLARMPHLLIAGTTGSGKSVAVNTMIMSLLYRLPPDRCKFIMIDPKMLELSVYDDIPHLLAPVVTDASKAVVALRWAVREMEERYRAMSNLGVRNIQGYNQRLADALANGEPLTRTVQTGFDPESGEPVYEEQEYGDTPLPHIVVIVDEMADLMLVAGKDVEAAVQRLAQMARAAGIHLIMATQRPSVDVITGTIKANFPTRVSFQVTSKIDSRTILGEGGAEQLLGQGDMLYMAGGGRISRVHGPFVSDEAVERVVRFLRDQGAPEYIDDVTEGENESPFLPPAGDSSGGAAGGGDALYDQAVAIVCRERRASTSFVQRHLQIGYNRAARMIERMETDGVISKPNHAGKREVLARDLDGHDS